MNLVNLLFFAFAFTGFLGLVYRLVSLQWRKNPLLIILMHGALAAACADASKNAWLGSFGVVDVGLVVGTLAWLLLSSNTWRNGVPKYFTKPAPLHDADLRHVNGGKQ